MELELNTTYKAKSPISIEYIVIRYAYIQASMFAGDNTMESPLTSKPN